MKKILTVALIAVIVLSIGASVWAYFSAPKNAAEPGLIGFCSERRLPFVTFTADELRAVGGEFTASEFVGHVTGVDNVCERSAVLAGGGELLIRKTALDGVTAAAAKRAVLLDFSREM